MKAQQYRGYTIEPDYVGFMFYKTEEGIDCHYDGESWKSNVRNVGTIEGAKEEIDEIISEEEYALEQERKEERAHEMGHLNEWKQETER